MRRMKQSRGTSRKPTSIYRDQCKSQQFSDNATQFRFNEQEGDEYWSNENFDGNNLPNHTASTGFTRDNEIIYYPQFNLLPEPQKAPNVLSNRQLQYIMPVTSYSQPRNRVASYGYPPGGDLKIKEIPCNSVSSEIDLETGDAKGNTQSPSINGSNKVDSPDEYRSAGSKILVASGSEGTASDEYEEHAVNEKRLVTVPIFPYEEDDRGGHTLHSLQEALLQSQLKTETEELKKVLAVMYRDQLQPAGGEVKEVEYSYVGRRGNTIKMKRHKKIRTEIYKTTDVDDGWQMDDALAYLDEPINKIESNKMQKSKRSKKIRSRNKNADSVRISSVEAQTENVITPLNFVLNTSQIPKVDVDILESTPTPSEPPKLKVGRDVINTDKVHYTMKNHESAVMMQIASTRCELILPSKDNCRLVELEANTTQDKVVFLDNYDTSNDAPSDYSFFYEHESPPAFQGKAVNVTAVEQLSEQTLDDSAKSENQQSAKHPAESCRFIGVGPLKKEMTSIELREWQEKLAKAWDSFINKGAKPLVYTPSGH